MNQPRTLIAMALGLRPLAGSLVRSMSPVRAKKTEKTIASPQPEKAMEPSASLVGLVGLVVSWVMALKRRLGWKLQPSCDGEG